MDINGSSACVRNISIKSPAGIIESRTNMEFFQAFFRNCKRCVSNCDNLLYNIFLTSYSSYKSCINEFQISIISSLFFHGFII